jgi:hypothetical protein
MDAAIARLKADAGGSKRRFLQLAYELIGSKYHTGRINTLVKFKELFLRIDSVWNRGGFMPCSQTNELMRIFLLKSGFFGPNEVRKRIAVFRLFIHQYLQVHVDGRWIDVDVGERQRGLKIGEHLGF